MFALQEQFHTGSTENAIEKEMERLKIRTAVDTSSEEPANCEELHRSSDKDTAVFIRGG